MSEVMLNLEKKNGESKNICTTRDQVAKLFIAILVNSQFLNAREGGGGGHSRARLILQDGSMIAYLLTDRALGDGDHFVS
jgi:hypothetical protein